MPVLLMRLGAPMQSWGASSRFTRRETEMIPTKSGVIGMLAAAIGLDRQSSLEGFSGLRFGVRADQPGTLMSDYHTAQKNNGATLPLSHRYYLQDAVFLVGLESDDRNRLEEYLQAVKAPHYQLFLGRRSCPPDGPIETEIVDGSLEDALSQAPWKATIAYQHKVLSNSNSINDWRNAEIIVEPKPSEGMSGFSDEWNDEPVSFDMRHRAWRPRKLRRLLGTVTPDATIQMPPTTPVSSNSVPTDIPEFDGEAMFEAVSQAGGR